RLLGGAGDGGAPDGTLGDVSHGQSTRAARGQRRLPGRAPGPEGPEADRIEAADTPRGGRDRDVVTIRKFESCLPRGYVEGPQTWASLRHARREGRLPVVSLGLSFPRGRDLHPGGRAVAR